MRYREGLGRRLRLVSDDFISEHANGAGALPAPDTRDAEKASTQLETTADAPPVQLQ